MSVVAYDVNQRILPIGTDARRFVASRQPDSLAVTGISEI